MTGARRRVLFLCTGNSCRSQMAEGFARALHGATIDAASAGVAPKGLDPRAVAVMREAGIDISGQESRDAGAFAGAAFDLVVTVCDAASEVCPVFPGARRTIHVPFDDPPRLARAAASEEDALEAYRRVRDEIRRFVSESLPALA